MSSFLLAFYAVTDLLDCPQSVRTYLAEVADKLVILQTKNDSLVDQLNYMSDDIEAVRKDRDGAYNQVWNLKATLKKIQSSESLQATEFELKTALGGHKLAAIKAHRTRTGLGLLESKDTIELAMVEQVKKNEELSHGQH